MSKRFFEEDLHSNFDNPVAGVISLFVMLLFSPYVFITTLTTKAVYLGPKSIRKLLNVSLVFGIVFTLLNFGVVMVSNSKLVLQGKSPVLLFVIADALLLGLKIAVEKLVLPTLEEVMDVVSDKVSVNSHVKHRQVDLEEIEKSSKSDSREEEFNDELPPSVIRTSDATEDFKEVVDESMDTSSATVATEVTDINLDVETKDDTDEVSTVESQADRQNKNSNEFVSSDRLKLFQQKMKIGIATLSDLNDSVRDLFSEKEISSIEEQFRKNSVNSFKKFGVAVQEVLNTDEFSEVEVKINLSDLTKEKIQIPVT